MMDEPGGWPQFIGRFYNGATVSTFPTRAERPGLPDSYLKLN